MKKTLNEQYRLIKEDKGHKGVFLKEAKRLYPNLITNSSTFKEAGDTETADSGIMQQVSAAITSAAVTMA